MAKSSTDSIIETVEKWYSAVPSLPKNFQEVLVKLAPWVALIFGILGLLAGIAGLGIMATLSPLAALGGVGGVRAAGSGILAAVLLIASSGLMLAAFPGLKSGKMNGWNMMFWSEVVTLVSSVLAISISGVVFDLVGFYLLFQIKRYYKA
ncbi:MAG: hypothetical protein ACM3IJ_04710 [Candidatus Levyibacteriota bacterium]